MNTMSRGRIVIIGSGIIGLTHALTALEAGWKVTLLERHSRPLGASVRNFGTLWPIGCRFGEERDQALFGVNRWKKMASEIGLWTKPGGSLSLAYREEAWAVLNEFANNPAAPQAEFQLLEPGEVRRRFPNANPEGLRGALYSSAETVVHSQGAIPTLAEYVGKMGAEMHFETPVIKVHEDCVETSSGEMFAFDHLVIAAGDEMRLLFPQELAKAQLRRCQLQMMRTVAQPTGFDMGAVFVSDHTLCHYPAFINCPSTAKLRMRLQTECPLHQKWGVHVIAAQHPDGTLVLGDTHEYAADFDPEIRMDLDELVLGSLREFTLVPDLRIATRWHGVYLKSTVGQTQVILNPRERVTMVTAMGGLGMTLSWGLADRTVRSWGA